MKLSFLSCALGVSLFAPIAAAADTTNQLGATLICRPAEAGDRANAAMTAQAQQLVCKPLAMEARMSDGSLHVIGSTGAKMSHGPAVTGALTAGQINDAWVHYLETEFRIDHSS